MSLTFLIISSLSISISILIFLLFFKSLLACSKHHKNLPPSPPRLPLIGNLHQLGSSPHHALQEMAQTYGQLMLVRLGTVSVLVASSADAAREIMKTHDLIFSNRPKIKIYSILTYGSKNIAFSQYGEYWRQAKSIAVLHVLTNKRVQSYRQVREDETCILITKIRQSAVVNLSEMLISLTNNVVCRVAFGRTYDGKNFKDLLGRHLELLGSFSVGTYIPWLIWVDRLSGLERRAHDVAKEMDEFLEGVIEEHANKKKLVVEGECQDIVDILLDIQRDNTMGFHIERDEIKAILMDVFAAGTDTTSTNLEWAISELLRHPEAMKKLQQEVREIGQGRRMISEDDLDKMPYLRAILKETLRLHPPFPLLVPHESTHDIKLLGYDIAAGTQVMINAWAIGRDSSTWTQPNEFQPERFLNSPISYQGFHFELIPFGAGRRGCPAIQFSMIINELVLANLVYKFDLGLAQGKFLDMSETSGLTAHKKYPILVTTTPCD